MLTVPLEGELVYHSLAQQGVLRVALNCSKYSGASAILTIQKLEALGDQVQDQENYSSWNPSDSWD